MGEAGGFREGAGKIRRGAQTRGQSGGDKKIDRGHIYQERGIREGAGPARGIAENRTRLGPRARGTRGRVLRTRELRKSRRGIQEGDRERDGGRTHTLQFIRSLLRS